MSVQAKPGGGALDVAAFAEREPVCNVGWPAPIDLDPLRAGGLARFYAWPGFHFVASRGVFTDCQFQEAGGKVDARTSRH